MASLRKKEKKKIVRNSNADSTHRLVAMKRTDLNTVRIASRWQKSTGKAIELLASTAIENRNKIEDTAKKLLDLHEKFDTNTNNEMTRFKSVTDGQTNLIAIVAANADVLEVVKEKQEDILHRLDNVSANGSLGLEATLKGIYQKNEEVHSDIQKVNTQLNEIFEVTKNERAWRNLRASVKQVINNSSTFAIFKTRTGTVVGVIILIILVNTLLHPLGINLDVWSLIQGVWNAIFGRR